MRKETNMQVHMAERTAPTQAAAAQSLEGWVRTLFFSVDAQDAAAFVAFLCDDAVFRYGSATEVRGRAAVRALVEGVFCSVLGCEHEVLRVWSMGERRIFEGVVTYTKHDRARLTLPFCNVLTMRGELIERYQIYIDPTPLLSR